jgi:hypothetical protein
VENATAQEAARRRPEMLHARLTAAGLERETAERRRAEDRERRLRSLGPTVWWVVIAFVAVLVVLLVAGWAFGAADVTQMTGVVLDRSSSTTIAEFDANVRAIERLILTVPAGGARVVVFAVDEKGFSSRPVFSATSPAQAGRFGEYLEAWQVETIAGWRTVAVRLEPNADGSQIFGTLSRVALEFEDCVEKRLIVFSDMRQVGHGFNFERGLDDPKATVKIAVRQGLIARLAGVKVWVLAAHTDRIDERHWNNLKVFWTEYFRRAGAELKAFTPGRRFDGK